MILDAIEHDDYSSIVKNSNDLHILNENGSESDDINTLKNTLPLLSLE